LLFQEQDRIKNNKKISIRVALPGYEVLRCSEEIAMGWGIDSRKIIGVPVYQICPPLICDFLREQFKEMRETWYPNTVNTRMATYYCNGMAMNMRLKRTDKYEEVIWLENIACSHPTRSGMNVVCGGGQE